MSPVPPATLRWQWSPFAQLGLRDLYEALRLRAQVFVLEQNCVFQDPDGRDADALHLLGWRDTDRAAPPQLAAYARVFAPGVRYADASIGRVVTAPEVRGTGAGHALMAEALSRIAQLAPGAPVRLEAQQRLEHFYASYGFVRVSEPYIEDGIPHVAMRREPPGTPGTR